MNQETKEKVEEAKEVIDEKVGEAKEVIDEKVGEAKEVIGEKVGELKEKINEMSVEDKIYAFYLFLIILCSILGMVLTKYEIISTSSAKGIMLGMMFGVVLSVYLWLTVGKKLVEEDKLKMLVKNI